MKPAQPVQCGCLPALVADGPGQVEALPGVVERAGEVTPPPRQDRQHVVRVGEEVSGLDVQPEVDRGTEGLPAGARVAIFGSGVSVPDRGLSGVLVGFDARLLDKAPVDGRFTTHHGLGLCTPEPDGAFDRVVITSRLSRLWPQWGEAVRAKAERIGASVHCVL